jgi:hypothetical protein
MSRDDLALDAVALSPRAAPAALPFNTSRCEAIFLVDPAKLVSFGNAARLVSYGLTPACIDSGASIGLAMVHRRPPLTARGTVNRADLALIVAQHRHPALPSPQRESLRHDGGNGDHAPVSMPVQNFLCRFFL